MAKIEEPLPEFAGFTPEALRLLAGLARNNTRDWFLPRKERITLELLQPMMALVEDATTALAAAKIGIRGDRKRSVFRIYRDVRFGHDKSPYRTTLAAYLSHDGERHSQGGIYIQIGPKESSLSAAFYGVPPPMLVRWRRDMAERPTRFKRVLTTLEKHGLELQKPEDWDDSLARMPRGFEAHVRGDLAPYFRLRHFVVRRDLTMGDVTSVGLVAAIVRLARDVKPLLDFGWSLD